MGNRTNKLSILVSCFPRPQLMPSSDLLYVHVKEVRERNPDENEDTVHDQMNLSANTFPTHNEE